MRMIALIANESLIYGNRSVGAGERFDATPIDAAVLTYRRRAAFAPRGMVAPPPSAPRPEPTPEPARPDRRSVRRVLEAAAETAEDSSEPSDEKPTRRRYRRRDLEPEA